MNLIGFLYLLLLFIVCFTVVHVVRLAILGFQSVKAKSKEKPAPPEKKVEKAPEPVYYIVEKKRSRNTYSKPKRIHVDKE
jgi:flagellar basal body-associated protein FliL